MNSEQCCDFKRKDILLQRYSATVLRFVLTLAKTPNNNVQAFRLIKNLIIRGFVDFALENGSPKN